MKTLRSVLDQILSVLAGVTFLAMVILTSWQVFTRYILGSPSTWSEELVGYLFAWMCLFGTVLVTGERAHMNIPILVDLCKPDTQKILNCVAELIAFAFSAIILLYGGIRISNLSMGQMTSALGIPIGIFYIVMPIAGVLNMIYTVMNIVDILSNKTEKEVS